VHNRELIISLILGVGVDDDSSTARGLHAAP
jgi:hypothetical protein